ncbi:MAG: CBS domain-containing protein [Rhodospirillaceae bacterium]
MDCKTVMAPIKVSLYADQPAAAAIDFMIEKHMGLVPVIERDGTFAGMISGDRLMGYLLPRALTTMADRRTAMHRASYLQETAEDMNERLDALRERPIGELIDRDIKAAHIDTPLIDALMLVKAKQYVVPVLDDAGRLASAISFFSVLFALREEYDREEAQRAKERERADRRAAKDGEDTEDGENGR